jgi:NarL family two-component system response regulator YdfI
MSKRNGGSVIRVLLAAASAVRRAGLETLIRNAAALKLAGSLQSTRNLAQHIRDLEPDVVLLDAEPGQPLDSALGSPIVVLVDEPDAAWTAQALRSGVKAILPRESDTEEILAAIQAAHAGFVLLDPEVTLNLAAKIRPPSDQETEIADDLTPREIEVLRMLSEGLGNREMAVRLGISDHTVKFHISSILDKLNASSRTEAVTLGIRMGLILL